MLIRIPVPVDLALLASTVKLISLIVLKAPALMEGHAQTKSMVTPAPAAQASQARTVSTK